MEDNEPPLSPREIHELREIIEKDKRWKWLAVTARNIAAWSVGLIAAYYAVTEFLGRIVKGLAK